MKSEITTVLHKTAKSAEESRFDLTSRKRLLIPTRDEDKRNQQTISLMPISWEDVAKDKFEQTI